jgi:hypothetical protein
MIPILISIILAAPLVEFDGAEMLHATQTRATVQVVEFRHDAGDSFAASIISRNAVIDGELASGVSGASGGPVNLTTGSIAMWINPLDWHLADAWRVLINWRTILTPNLTGQSMQLRGGPDGRLVMMLGNFEQKQFDLLFFDIFKGETPSSGWRHVAVTWDQQAIRAYVNGEIVAETARENANADETWSNRFRLGGPQGGGVEQGHTAIHSMLISNNVLDLPAVVAHRDAHTAIVGSTLHVDLLAATFGPTAYASSFGLEPGNDRDPRKVIQRAEHAAWRPDPDDAAPWFYITWPGEVPLGELTLHGYTPPAPAPGVQLVAGPDRLNMQPVTIRQTTRDDGATVLALDPPISARVIELRFASPDVELRRLEAQPGDVPPPEASNFRAGEVITVPLSEGMPISPGSPLLCEIEQTGSAPFRKYQDYRAARVMVTQPGSIVAHLSPFAVSGVYDIYLSSPGATQREKVGSITIEGVEPPQYDGASGGEGFPRVSMDLQSRMLPTLDIDGETVPFVVMALAGPSFDRIAGYARSGARLWKINASGGPLLDTPDIAVNVDQTIAELDINMRNLLALAPDGYMMIALDTRPRAAWQQAYADQVHVAADGRRGFGVNFGSQQLRDDINASVRLFTERVAEKPYANRVIGILPYFGRGGDGWGYGVAMTVGAKRDNVVLGDRSIAERDGFRRWLGDDTAEVPPDSELAATDDGVFLDPAQRKRAIDYWLYRAESVASMIIEAGEQVQQISGDRLLYGAHYGYALVNGRNLAPAASQLGGHYRLDMLLDSPAIKVVNGGSAGDKRGPHDNYEPMAPLGSAILHGKLPILELDNRTTLTRGAPPYEYYQLFSERDFHAAARKDIGFALTHGAGLWWYDLSSPGSSIEYAREPWYHDATFMAMVRDAIEQGMQPSPKHSLDAPVAVFFDEAVMFRHDVYASWLYDNLLRYLTESLHQAGAGVRTYLLSDYPAWKASDAAKTAKLEIFFNAYMEPAFGWEPIRTSERAQLWFYAANALSRDAYHPQPPTRDLLGFNLERHDELSVADSLTSLGYGAHPYSDFHASQRVNFGETLSPWYTAVAPEQTLGVFANGQPALARGRSNRYFSSLPFMPASVLRLIYARVGIDTDVPLGDWWVAAGRDLISINTMQTVRDPNALDRWLETRESLFAGDAATSVIVRSPR